MKYIKELVISFVLGNIIFMFVGDSREVDIILGTSIMLVVFAISLNGIHINTFLRIAILSLGLGVVLDCLTNIARAIDFSASVTVITGCAVLLSLLFQDVINKLWSRHSLTEIHIAVALALNLSVFVFMEGNNILSLLLTIIGIHLSVNLVVTVTTNYIKYNQNTKLLNAKNKPTNLEEHDLYLKGVVYKAPASLMVTVLMVSYFYYLVQIIYT